MSIYYTNNKTTKQILNLLDNLEEKLSKTNKSKINDNIYKNSNYSNYNIDLNGNNNNSFYQNPQINSFSKEPFYQNMNTNQSPLIPKNILMDQSSDLFIRNIIKEEFKSLILPYQIEMNNNINIIENKTKKICGN